MRRSTFVVSDRLADRRVRDRIAREGRLGQRVLTLPGLAARLAGGFSALVPASEVRRALQEPPLQELSDLERIAVLPGFARAAAATLHAAWNADLDLAAEARASAADPRWAELAALETHVRAHLPRGAQLPRDLVAAARARAHLAEVLLGDVTLESVDEVPPLYRPLLLDVAEHVRVRWRPPAGARPTWVGAAIDVEAAVEHQPALSFVSCADPAHEALEAMRWVRQLLVSGVPASDIAVAAVDVAAYDDRIRALVVASGLPVHAAQGLAALGTPGGQFAASFADALLLGPNQERVRRLVASAKAAADPVIGALPDDWSAELKPDAALGSVPQWRRALAALQGRSPRVAELLLRLVVDLSVGVGAAATLGERWLSGAALGMWRHALTEGPASALPTSLQRIRVSDGVDPATAVVWAPAATLLGWPRPHVRLLGLSGRSWPRRGSDEDPLLPSRVLGDKTLFERTPAKRDADHLSALLASTGAEAVLSRSRRGSDGRRQSPSPLLRGLLAGADEVERAPRQGAGHAVSEADRLASRRVELRSDPRMNRALRAYRSALDPALGAHDGRVRRRHPVIMRALGRRHSATSLRKLLRNPHGFVATYALGWSEPQPQRELLSLDPLGRGSLLHEVLEAALDALRERGQPLGDLEAITAVVKEACAQAGERWELERPVPPPVAWRAELERAARVAVRMLTVAGEPSAGQRSYAEVRFGYDPNGDAGANGLPWPPDAEVKLPGTDLRLRGVIDRLDIDEANRHVRVIDYKSGKGRDLNGDLDEGQELQRTLYTVVARELLGEEYTVEAGLLHADAEEPLLLEDPDGSIELLSAAAQEAARLLADGHAVPGPGITDPFEENLLAYPASGPHLYRLVKGEALEQARGELDRLLAVTA